MKTFDETLEFVKKAHKGQRDKAGEAYWVHPFQVSTLIKGGGEVDKIVALLHDILEDTQYTYSDLKEMGYTDEVLIPLVLLTKTKGEDYNKYLDRVVRNPIAIRVKMADLTHNMDINRLPLEDRDTEVVRKRTDKYKKAYKRLQNVILKSNIVRPMVVGLKMQGNYVVGAVVVDTGYKNTVRTIPANQLWGITFNNMSFTDCKVDEKGFINVDKIKGFCGSPKRYNIDSNGYTVLGCNSEGTLYRVSNTRGKIEILTLAQMRNLVKMNVTLTNCAILDVEKGTFRGITQLNEDFIVQPVSDKELESLIANIEKNKIKRDKVKEIDLTGYPKGSVPVHEMQNKLASHILDAMQFQEIRELVTREDEEVLMRVADSSVVPREMIKQMEEIYGKVKNINKDKLIKKFNMPNELLESTSFMDMLNGSSTVGIVQNMQMFRTLDEDEKTVYTRMISGADKITEEVQDIARQMNVKMYGLSKRVKSISSFCEKIRDREEVVDKKKELENISDVVRFTMVIDSKTDYGKMVNQAIMEFKDRGYSVKKVKNFWVNKRSTYKGVNCQLVSPDGIPFEMQFHVPSYLRIKDEIHSWYELRRDTKNNIVKGSPRYEYCLYQEQALTNTVVIPDDVDLIEQVG